jgi:hypothetical protein
MYENEPTIASEETKFWWSNNLLHRKDGPAIERADGDRLWYLNGKLHREVGPAIVYANGEESWYLDGVSYTEEEFNKIINEVKQLPLELKLTDPRWWVREMT